MDGDPRIEQLREQVSLTDRAIVDAFNTRLGLVARIKEHKASLGLDFVDPKREEWMLEDLARANRGPLSQQGLAELLAELLDLTKREVGRGDSG